MKDRQDFSVHTLKNGITVYSHAMDVPFFSMSIIIPVGSKHNHEGNPGGIPGTAHFLEHIIFNRSKLYPTKDGFSKSLALRGGYSNASTGLTLTKVYVYAPNELQDQAVAGLIEHVWYPILSNEEDIATERGIVANERNQRKYYPGTNEISKYLLTEWMYDYELSKQAVFGADEDLSSMTPESLSAFHASYFVNTAQVLVGGGHDLAPILQALERIETTEVQLTPESTAVRWQRREYHEHTFKDIESPMYFVGGIFPEYNVEDSYGISFILDLLTNSAHGPLYVWTRDEKGWSYGVSEVSWYDLGTMVWYIQMPLNTVDPVEIIRKELHGRITAALSDKDLVHAEVERQLASDVFSFQTLGSRLGPAEYTLKREGRIVTEQEYIARTKRCDDPEWLMSIYKKYMSPDVVGEFLALPESI